MAGVGLVTVSESKLIKRRYFLFGNTLGGTLSGPKRPIFHHTSHIFLTVALLRPTKTRFVWQKMATFLY
jgi:hypothetical protein